MPNNPTVVIGSLNDDELKKSIDKLVNHVDEQLNYMVSSTKVAVMSMNKSLKSLGDTKIDFGGSADGGASKRTKAQNAETDAVEKTIAARDKQIKKNQEAATSFDNFAKAQQKAASASTQGSSKTVQEEVSSLEQLKQKYTEIAALSSKRFDESPIQTLRMRQHELEAGMRTASTEAAKAKKDVDELNAAIEAYRKTIASLPKDKNGFAQQQSIQKEINDMIVLRDTAIAEQQKWTDAGRQLSTQYEDVKAQIRGIGQELINANNAQQDVVASASRYSEEIKNQISSIANKKDATKAFEQISLMPSNTMDEIKAKGQALVEIVKKVKDTPLMSQTNVKLAEKMIGSLANQYRALKEEKEKIAGTQTTNASAENTTRRSLEQERQDLERLKALQEERRQQIIQTGLAAQQQARSLRESIGQQMQTADYTKPIDYVKLQNALTEMKNAYKQPIDSSIKKSLEEDIAITQKALDIAKRYSMTVAGLGAVGVGGKAPTDTLAAYSAEAQRLAGIYKNLSTEERNASAGQGLKRKYQELGRAASQVRKELERPINLKDVLGLSEKTLDDIVYKMQRLHEYKQGIDLTKPNSTNEIKQVDEALAKLQKDADKWMGKSQEMIKNNTALVRSWNYMKNRLAFYFTVGASQQFVKNLIEIRSQYEMNERALGILINSAERGTQIFQELSNMALVSPYTLIELSTAAKQLTAYDVAAKDVVDTTRRLADMAAAVGIPIERLTYALGQIKAYGYLNARDARMFSNAGIPLVKQLSEYYTELEGKLVSTADVYDRIKKKAIGYNDVMQVVNKMTDEGGKFFDFQAKMADTLKVRLANLTLAWNNMLNDIGKSEQGILTWMIGSLRDLFTHWKELNSALTSVAWAGGLIVAMRALNVLLVKSGVQWGILSKQMTTAGIVGTTLTGKLLTVGASLKALVTSSLTWWSLLAFAVVDVTRALINMDEAQKTLNKSIRDGAKDNYDNISKFLEQYKELRKSLYTENDGIIDIDKKEASKAWESIREQIELTTKNADVYIGRLLSISNISERVRQGFNLLEDIAAVNAALKESGDDVIKLEGDFMKVFGFTIGDGTITNLKDYADLLKNITDQYGSLENAQIAAKNGVDGVGGSLHNLDVYLETLQEDLGKTTDSILNFIQLKGWSGDVNKIRETFSLAFNKIALENNLTPQQATQLRVQSAKAEYEAIQLALRRHIADENVALSKARNDNEKADIESRMRVYKDDLSFMQSNTAQSRVYWEDFTKWMGEQHKSEVQAMFKGQTSEQIKMLDFSRGEYNKWVVELAQKYAKEHGMSYKEVYDQLHNYILNANQWSIRIPLIIDIQSPSWLQEDFKNRLPDSTIDVSQYNTLSSAISDWQKKRKEGLEEIQRLEKAGIYLTTGGTEADREHYAEVQKEVSDATAALKAYNAELTKETKGKGKDPVLEALRTEIDLVKRAQSEYDKLTKSGASSAEALDTVYSSFGNTIKKLNVQLQGFGLPELELKDVIKGNPNETLKFFKKLREELTAQGLDKLERMKAVEVVLEEFSLKAKTYNLDMLTKGLNSELGKIKDEYELAVELDANPELGGLFVEMFGLDEDALNKLPRTYNQVMKRLQEGINKEFKKNNVSLGFDLSKMLSKEAFDKWVEQNGHLIEDNLMKQLDESRKYAIKVRRDEFKNQTEQWNKLIEKYGEYQSKIRKIDEDVADERYAIIKKYGEDSDIVKAIDLTNKIKVSDDPAEVKRLSEELNKLTEKVVNKSGKEKAVNLSESVSNYDVRRKAEVDFEEFQHTDYWVAATSQLSDFTNKGLRVLIDSLKEYKKEAKNLDPKKIKQLNDTIRKLEKELKSRNPFTRLADSIKEFKKNSEYGADEIAALEKKINALRDKLNTQREESGFVNLDDLALYKKLNEELKKMKMNYAAIGESNAMREVASSMNDILGYAQDVVTIFKAIGDANKNDLGLARAAELAGDIVGNLQAAGQGFASGGWIGAVAGGVTDLIPKIVKWINKEDEIDDALKKSAITVTELQNAYKALEEAVEDAFGTAKYGAMQTARANKELQLAELKRQLQLEESRSSKNKDYQAIANLRGQIADLEREIANTTKEIVNDLLGITSVGSFAETLVLSMIEAFRQGEDYMKKYEESFEDMIDNMIMKSIVSKVIGDKIQSLWDEIEKNAEKRGGDIQSEIKRRQGELAQMREMYSKMESDEYGFYEDNGKEISREEAMRNMEKLIAEAEADIARLQKEYGEAISPTPDDVKGFKEKGQDWKDNISNELKAFMDAFGIKFGEDDKNKLSGLKQGLQSMSENTAGALEAYMNGVSQQVYYHSSLLEQIRDSVVGLDLDVSLGVQSQILLQLQNSYQTQQAIHGILEGVLNPSGRAFSVELLS